MQLLANIDVGKRARAEAFYCAAFGRVVAASQGQAGRPQRRAAAPSLARLPSAPDTDPSGFCVNVDAAVIRAQLAGARLEQPARSHSWGTDCSVRASGTGFCPTQFLGRGCDEIAVSVLPPPHQGAPCP